MSNFHWFSRIEALTLIWPLFKKILNGTHFWKITMYLDLVFFRQKCENDIFTTCGYVLSSCAYLYTHSLESKKFLEAYDFSYFNDCLCCKLQFLMIFTMLPLIFSVLVKFKDLCCLSAYVNVFRHLSTKLYQNIFIFISKLECFCF